MEMFFNIPDSTLVEVSDTISYNIFCGDGDSRISTGIYRSKVSSLASFGETKQFRISVHIEDVLGADVDNVYPVILEREFCEEWFNKMNTKKPDENSETFMAFYFSDDTQIEIPIKIWKTSDYIYKISFISEDVAYDLNPEIPTPKSPDEDGIEFLSTSAEKIMEMAISMSNTSSEIESLNTYLKEVEIAEMEKVTSAEDSNGKPLYSNDTKRQIQLKKQLAEDEEYNTNKEKLKELQERLKQDSIGIQFLRDKQSNLRVLLPLISNR